MIIYTGFLISVVIAVLLRRRIKRRIGLIIAFISLLGMILSYFCMISVMPESTQHNQGHDILLPDYYLWFFEAFILSLFLLPIGLVGILSPKKLLKNNKIEGFASDDPLRTKRVPEE